jgi:predicted naringenin-chalcone synthase
MTTLTKPAIVRPAFEVTQADMLDVLKTLFPDHPQWDVISRMIRNTQVAKRYLVRPLAEIVKHAGFEARNQIYTQESQRLGRQAVEQALEHAAMTPQDIDMIIVTSCTGFMMPSLTAYLMSELPFNCTTKQLPIAQLGCVAGASAINRAFEYCTAFPGANVLIVCVEFSSLCFQPTDASISDLISSALFGDSIAACIMSSSARMGYEILANRSFLLKHTQRYIAYDVKDTGFHFVLDKNVMHTIEKVAPVMKEFTSHALGCNASDLDFFIFHTGGRRILDELVQRLHLEEEDIALSRRSLAECGNISSAVVFDVLHRMFEQEQRRPGEQGMLAAFGPGFTAEMNVGMWRN